MATASLLCNIFTEVYQKKGMKYCMICFRTMSDRRLVEGTNVMKFKYFRQSNRIRSENNSRYEKSAMLDNFLVCYMCDRQAAAAVRFCIGFNLSNKLHYMFSKMKLSQSYRKDVFNLLQKTGDTCEEFDKEATELETTLATIRNTNNLLQTETLTLGNDVNDDDASSNSREKLRDLFSFETKPVTDEDPLAELTELSSQPDLMTKTILLEDDEVSNEEPRPVAIIHNNMNRQTGTLTHIPIAPNIPKQTYLQTLIQNQTGMILQPVLFNLNENNQNIILNNGSLTPISNFNGPNLVANPIGNVGAPLLNQLLNKNQFIPINNLNANGQFILPVSQSSAVVPQDRTSVMVSQNNLQHQNHLHDIQKCIQKMASNMQNKMQNNVQNKNTLLISSVKSENPNVLKKKVSESVGESVKCHMAGVKRSDKCQVDSDSAPSAVKSGKIDWEDKIPMDVISCVTNSDPSVKGNSTGPAPAPDDVALYKDPVDNVLITDVKSISEMPPGDDVIDLC